jgi:hypothetical protein
MTEGVQDPAKTPAMLVGHLGRYLSTSRYCLRHHSVGIIDH